MASGCDLQAEIWTMPVAGERWPWWSAGGGASASVHLQSSSGAAPCVQKVEAAALSRGAIDVRDTDATTFNVWNTNDAACCHC